MTNLTTSALSTEVLEDALLTLEQISTRITVLALNASRNPEQAQGADSCQWSWYGSVPS